MILAPACAANRSSEFKATEEEGKMVHHCCLITAIQGYWYAYPMLGGGWGGTEPIQALKPKRRVLLEPRFGTKTFPSSVLGVCGTVEVERAPHAGGRAWTWMWTSTCTWRASRAAS